jgi:hypothetical protein
MVNGRHVILLNIPARASREAAAGTVAAYEPAWIMSVHMILPEGDPLIVDRRDLTDHSSVQSIRHHVGRCDSI